MRAREFLSEMTGSDDSSDSSGSSSNPGNRGKKGTMHPHHKSAIKGLNTFPEYPGWYYNMYRFGVSMAASPDDNNMSQLSPTANQLNVYAYTDAEQVIIDKSKKHMGVKGQQMTTNKSEEADDVNKTSMTNKPKKNKYGI